MKVQLNTNLVHIFSGTYETSWDVVEIDDHGNEFMVDYDHQDLMRSIANAYEAMSDNILQEMNIPFIKGIKFMGSFYSPREYNFETDSLDLELDINEELLVAKLEDMKGDADFDGYLHDHYTSRDGFMSFTPNNYADLATTITKKGDDYDQALGALITYLIRENQGDSNETIDYMVNEYWQGNGYGGLNYKVVDDDGNELHYQDGEFVKVEK